MSNLFQHEADKKGQPITIGLFVLVLGFIVIVSNVIPMPRRDRVDRSLDLIMLEAIEMAVAAEESTEPPIEDEVSEPEATAEQLDELLSSFTEMSSFKLIEEDATQSDRGETESLALQADFGLDFGGQDDLGIFGSSRSNDLDPNLAPQKSTASWTLKPNIVTGSVSVSNSQLSSGVDVSQAELVLRPDQPDRLVESIVEDFDEDVSLTSEEIRRENAVIRWMLERLNELDRPVRTVFEQKSSDLTVNEMVIIGPNTYNLQMMYSPINRTLHIAWIDGEEIYYFVDPALQYQINYFEEGIVERGEVMEVVLLETEELSAESPQARREYQIFVNWWKPQIDALENG